MAHKASLWRRVLGVASKVLLGLFGLLLLLPVLVLMSLRVDAVRARAAGVADSALASAFRGRLRIESVAWVDLSRVLANARIEDDKGRTVVRADGLEARIFWPRLVWDVLSGGEPLHIDIDEVSLNHAEVWLIDDGSGVPTLATAFDPRTPSTTPGTGPAPVVTIGKISARHVWVHGELAPVPPLDADVSGLVSSLRFDERALELPIERATLVMRGLPNQLEPRGSLRGTLRLPSGAAGPEIRAAYRGALAGTGVSAQFSLRGQALEGRLEAPRVERETLARFSPELELAGSLHVLASVAGTLPDLRFDASLSGEAGRVKTNGTLRLEEKTGLTAALEAHEVDVAKVVRGAPTTNVDAALRVQGTLNGGVIELGYDVRSERASFEGEPLPPLSTQGTLRVEGEKLRAAGELAIDEPGAATNAAYEALLSGGRGSIEVRTSTELREPPRLRALADVSTSGRLTSALRLALPEQRFAGTIGANLARTSFPSGAIGRTSVNATVRGSLDDPAFGVKLDGRSLKLPGRAFERVRISAQGTPRRVKLSGRLEGRYPDELWFDTTLLLGSKTELYRSELALVDREGPIKLSAERFSIAKGAIELEELRLEGPGRAELSFEQRGTTLHAKLRTLDLDLGRLARLAGLASPLKSARTTLDARYDSEAGNASGFVVGHVDDVAYADVRRAQADIDLRLAEQRLTGTVAAAFAPGARAVLALDDVVVPGPPFELPAPDRLLGRIALRGDVDLAGMSALLATLPDFPIGEARGRVNADVVYERSAEALPRLEARVRTSGLDVAGRLTRKEPIRTTDEAIAASSWHVTKVDVDAALTLDAERRELTLSARGFDERGELVRVQGTASELPVAATFASYARAWQDVPLRATVAVPERKFRHLPTPLRPDATNGTVTLAAELAGTARAPRVDVSGRLGGVRAAGGRELGVRPPRLDVDFQASYARSGGKFAVQARRDERPAAELTGSFRGDVLKFDPEKSTSDFSLTAEAKLEKVELDTIAALKNRQIGGELSGEARVEYGAERRELALDLRAEKLELGQVVLDSVHADLLAREGELRGELTVRGKGGSLDAAIRSGLLWRGRLTPTPQGDIDANVDARALRLGALFPLTSSSFSELDGRLDAKLTARVRGGQLALSGHGKLNEGVVQLPALGQRFDRIQARIDVMPQEIRVRDVRAHGVSGALSAESAIFLDEQLALREVRGAVRIRERDRIPVTLEGVTIGEAWGNIDATYLHKSEGDRVSVKFSGMHLDVPDVDQHSVQSLEPAEGVRIGVHQQDRKFVVLPIQPLEQGAAAGEKAAPMVVDIDLGKGFSVRRGDMIDVQLTGKLQARVAEETSVTGRIQLAGGTLDVSGKRFEIERGTIAFTGGDPANPTVTALARWDSPAGYSVFAEYDGTAENGHLKLRAEPPLNEDQIVTLLMFGTPDGSYAGSSSGDSSDTAAGAFGIAGSTAARGLNRALSSFTKLDVQARVDTSTGSARPEIVVGLGPRLSARVTRAIGEPAAGTSPDRTFLTLELRLKRNWALSGLVGDRGASALDLIWRHRY